MPHAYQAGCTVDAAVSTFGWRRRQRGDDERQCVGGAAGGAAQDPTAHSKHLVRSTSGGSVTPVVA